MSCVQESLVESESPVGLGRIASRHIATVSGLCKREDTEVSRPPVRVGQLHSLPVWLESACTKSFPI
jgi:hypothetical protein